jgi:flagellar motility protein MotE (MotC chaperone)
MGGLLTLKVYLLTSSLLFANTPEGATAAAQTLAGSKQDVPPVAAPTSTAPVPAASASPCAKDMTCIGQQSKAGLDADQTVDTARQALVRDIETRTKELDREAQELENLKRTIDASQAALEERMQKYTSVQDSLVAQTRKKQELSDADVDRLVKIYEAMPPREAASIFDVLDFKVAVPVMIKMNPRKASAILAGMSPERAMIATQLLAGIPHKPVVAHIGTNG